MSDRDADPSRPTVHDNNVFAVTIECERGQRRLHTSYPTREPSERTDVVFKGVIAHQFQHMLPGNILFGIEEEDVESVVRENAELFQTSWRYGWPPIEYRADLRRLEEDLRVDGVRAFWISSPYGLTGWVLARECQFVRQL